MYWKKKSCHRHFVDSIGVQKEDWAIVLNTLWQAAVNLESKLLHEAPTAAVSWLVIWIWSGTNHFRQDEELINQYTIILNHIAKLLSPDEFLALLPVDVSCRLNFQFEN